MQYFCSTSFKVHAVNDDDDLFLPPYVPGRTLTCWREPSVASCAAAFSESCNKLSTAARPHCPAVCWWIQFQIQYQIQCGCVCTVCIQGGHGCMLGWQAAAVPADTMRPGSEPAHWPSAG